MLAPFALRRVRQMRRRMQAWLVWVVLLAGLLTATACGNSPVTRATPMPATTVN